MTAPRSSLRKLKLLPEEPVAEPAIEAPPVPAKRPVARSRADKRAITFYLSEEAWEQLRTLSVKERTPTHMLCREAINLLFAQRGCPASGDESVTARQHDPVRSRQRLRLPRRP